MFAIPLSTWGAACRLKILQLSRILDGSQPGIWHFLGNFFQIWWFLKEFTATMCSHDLLNGLE
jgi:hypothetical protein